MKLLLVLTHISIFLQLSCAQMVVDYIVVGAGLSGLAAARGLQDANYDVVVLEAKDYRGGRVKTIDINGVTTEAGAMWLYGWSNRNPTKRLATAAGASKVLMKDDWDSDYKANVKCYDEETKENFPNSDIIDLATDFLKPRRLRQLKNRLPSNANMLDAAENYVSHNRLTGSEARKLRFIVDQTYVESDYGGSSASLSLEYFWEDEDFNGQSFMLPNGYTQLVDDLARGLDIRLNTPVTEVNYGTNTVVVKAASGQTFTAKGVIITVPLGVLKSGSITFSPPLPSYKQKAINNLGMGTVEKVILTFSEKFWTEIGFIFMASGDKKGTFSYIYDISNVVNAPALVAWHGGPTSTATLSSMSDAEIVTALVNELSIILGKICPQPTGSFVSRWQQDPYTRGSYSYYAVGSHPSDMDKIARPINNKVFFAGEHTQKLYYESTHGALLSGEKAARQIDNSVRMYYW